MKNIRVLTHVVAAAITVPLTVTSLAAQNNSVIELEEVIVTAQKREERLSEVPISIASFSAENITQTGIRQLKEVAEFIPNLSISSGNDFNSTIIIRGVGANSRNIGFDARVGVYVDGVYLGQSPALNQELLDLERIEVLRGPQGTLFGKNTVAGAVNLITKKPTNTMNGSVGVEVGNFNSRQYSASINVPLTNKLFSKVSVNQQQRDGVVKNVVTSNEINELDGLAYRAQLLFTASESFEMNLSFDRTETDRLSYTGEAVTDTFGFTRQREAPKDNEVSMNFDPTEERDIMGTALTMDWDLANAFAIKSITAYRDTDIFYVSDADYSALDFIAINYNDQYKQFSQELQIISPDDSDLKYVAGLYYYDQEGSTSRQVLAGLAGALVFGVDPTIPTATDGVVDTRSYAGFFNGSYVFSDDWTLGVGVRYSRENKEVDWRLQGSGSGDFGIGTGRVIDERTDSHLSPTINLSYAFTRDINGYLKYSSGYKSGGFNLDFVTAVDLVAGVDFDKETVDSYEVGLKGTLLDRRLMFGLAVFQSTFDDYQVNQYLELGAGQTSITIRNAAEVQTQGLELETTYIPSERWQIMTGLGLLEGEFNQFPGGGFGGSDVSGNTLPYVPEVSFSFAVQYYYPLLALGAELLARVDYSFRGDYYASPDNQKSRILLSGETIQFGYVDDVELVNARVGLESSSGNWRIALWGRNLADKDYLTSTERDFLGTINHFRGIPRTYGIELEYNF